MGEAETMLRETQQSLDHLGAPPPEGTRARRMILRESAGRVARLVRDACKGSYDGVLADESNLRIFARFSQATARFNDVVRLHVGVCDPVTRTPKPDGRC